MGLLDVERGQAGQPPRPASVQAPHPLIWQDKWFLFYNSAGARCFLSDDGIQWKQHASAEGKTKFFDMGRDVALFRDEPRKRWIAYYCGTVQGPDGRRGAMVARTAPALDGPWSQEETPVRTQGNPESPQPTAPQARGRTRTVRRKGFVAAPCARAEAGVCL